MSLSDYKKKRSFTKTPEPVGGKTTKNELRFVVQKHAASHLHYDFRLEMEGVLKSWAVPKGPSLDVNIKRLAMMVEDHPYDYRTFEGIIPEGNYGAGTVIVWDEGTYESAETKSKNKKDQEKDLLHQLHGGKIKFIMHGKKLKGGFALVKAFGRGENSWLLLKHEDEYASEEDITENDKSVKSDLTLEQVAKTSNHIHKSNRKATVKKKANKVKEAVDDKTNEQQEALPEIAMLLKDGKKAAFPENVNPMLATLTDAPFDGENWIYEIKWDGYRAIAYLQNGEVALRSRKNISFDQKYAAVSDALNKWDIEAVVDGEIIAANENGEADFQTLQNFAKTGGKASLIYYLFDILWVQGKDLKHLPLLERKSILQSLIPPQSNILKYSDHIPAQGKAFFEIALQKGLEGIMAKKADSEYITGYRTKSWLKIKNNKITEAIICGFTKGRNSRKYFGAVVLGKYENKKLIYIGHSGSGFNEKSLNQIYNKFEPLITDECPFEKKPKTNMPVTWLKPTLVCEVKFSEWTEDKILRHPIFMNLREDKNAASEKNEKIVPPPPEDSGKKAIREKTKTPKKIKSAAKPLSKEEWLKKDEKEKTVTLNSHRIKLTNLDKIYWPDEKISKRDLLNYYHNIAPYILSYLTNRPQSLNRHPNGISGANFYQKNVEGKVPGWVTTHPYTSESDGKQKQFFVCTNEASLIYMASLGCIEMNPWHSRIQSPENPDWCVIDLDPDDNPYDQVVEAALAVKEVLDNFKIPAYCKTSGATGMHIYIPLEAKYTYDQSRMLAQLIVSFVHQNIPSFTSLERTPSKRKGLIYLDFLQNRSIQTIAAPYSLRPKPGATVSTPLHWEEVKKGLSPKAFTIFNIMDRLKKEGDLFKPVLAEGIDLQKTIDNISAVMK